MNEEQVKELLERYDDLRELVVRVNANMNQINEVGDLLHKKENDLETKLADLSRKIAAVEKTAGGLMNANPRHGFHIGMASPSLKFNIAQVRFDFSAF